MDTLNYRLEVFEGPLDLLLSLIHKNKVDIHDIPISLICGQYMEYLRAAETMDMELASEFLVMASELMLIKSRMMLPRTEAVAEDPRAALSDALLRYEEAKAAAAVLAAHYNVFSGRMVKDTDEITTVKTYVADQSPDALLAAVRRILAFRDERPRAEAETFTPMIASPIIPVETKIIGILRHFDDTPPREPVSLRTLLSDASSLPDLIAIFLGVLELMRMRRLLPVEDPDDPVTVLGADVSFTFGVREPETEDDPNAIQPMIREETEVSADGD